MQSRPSLDRSQRPDDRRPRGADSSCRAPCQGQLLQSLLGIIFIVGIKVANTVLMSDFAQELRRHEGLTPTEAIRKAASIRVRPVTMTALAAFVAMIPTALAFEHGSEVNAPLARAILGGLLAGEPATLFVLPCLYSLLVRDNGKGEQHIELPAHVGPGLAPAGV